MLTIETIDGLISIRNPATNDVWLFDSQQDVLVFVQAWFSDNVSGVLFYGKVQN